MNKLRLYGCIGLIILTIFGCGVVIKTGITGEVVGYWKPYHGPPVPENAFQAGITQISGQNVGVYVGLVFMEEIIPGAGKQIVAIFNNTDYVLSTYEDLIQVNTSIKILCLKKGKKIKWAPSKLQDESEATYHYIIGGHELSKTTGRNTNLYIGRAMYNNTLVVGKVEMLESELHFRPYYADKEILIKDNFEVLAYPNSPDPL